MAFGEPKVLFTTAFYKLALYMAEHPSFFHLVLVVLFSTLMLVAGLYLLTKYNQLFRYLIRNEWVRRNLAVWLIAVCLFLALTPTTGGLYAAKTAPALLRYFLRQIIFVTIEALFVFNITWAVIKGIRPRFFSFRQRMAITLATIILCCILVSVTMSYIDHKGSFKDTGVTILYSFYMGCMTGLVYVAMSYVELERKKKLNEKELEVARLQTLKTKAELDALHSKINPHFLYNALNSIADLSITDGKKARKMTIALADLFRYSINYSDNNYSTVSEEVEMAEVYLQIEKIRFEDQLTYTVAVDEKARHLLLPRFLLQPLVENAVKHGLKRTGQMTQIFFDVKVEDENKLTIIIADNGPAFPDEMIPGYGVKSVFDKLDLLFPGQYEIHFSNHPRKQLVIYISKLLKNEPGI
jgi:sensor histidine kinase YesM